MKNIILKGRLEFFDFIGGIENLSGNTFLQTEKECVFKLNDYYVILEEDNIEIKYEENVNDNRRIEIDKENGHLSIEEYVKYYEEKNNIELVILKSPYNNTYMEDTLLHTYKKVYLNEKNLRIYGLDNTFRNKYSILKLSHKNKILEVYNNTHNSEEYYELKKVSL